MKITILLIVAGLLCGSALARDDDRNFYIINAAVPNDITYVQKRGNNYYVSPPAKAKRRLTDDLLKWD